MSRPALRVGCCGWAMRQASYVATFPVIELQATFYQPPDQRVVERWRSLAPAGFEYCLKAWQLITHTPASPTYRHLKFPVSAEEHDLYGSFRPTEQVALAWERTRAVAATLDARVVVFQCPRSFLPSRENLRNFGSFFASIERDGRTLAWEPRGEAWLPELVGDLCAEHDLIHCVDPFVAHPARGGPIYWRLHGRGGYRYRYTAEDLEELSAIVDSHASAGSNHVLFNNIYSKDDAQRFAAMRMNT